MNNANKSELLENILEEILKGASYFVNHIEHKKDSIMIIGAVSDGKKVQNKFTLAGDEEQISEIVFRAMQKDDRVVRIMMSALKKYLDSEAENVMSDIIGKVLSELARNCQCPDCVERRKRQKMSGN